MMKIDKAWFKKVLVDCGAVKYGDFQLASGKKSEYYADIKIALTRPDILKVIAQAMTPHTSGYARIAGVELGAVPIVVAVSLETGLPYIIVRKQKKEHGTQKLYEGEIKKGEKMLFVEDVITTGGTLAKAIQLIRSEGPIVDKVICVVDREEGGKENLQEIDVELISLITGQDLIGAP